MIPVQTILPDALATLIRKAPLSPEKVAFAWRTAVGPSLARVTTVSLTNRVLHVRATNETWRREVERSAALIRVRLESLLGPDVVRGLNVTIG
jgi:hypothetical protein